MALNPSYEDSKLHEMATLMATDTDFAVFRKFSELNFFNFLHIQHRLIELEAQLHKNLQARLSVAALVVEIRQLLKDHNAAYAALSALRDAHRPSEKTVSVIRHFSDNHLREFVDELGGVGGMRPERLMSLAATDKSWARNFVDDHPFLQRMFRIKNLEKETAGIRYFYDVAFLSVTAKLERLLLTLGFCLLLLGPVYWLSYTKDTRTKLGIVAGFVVCVSLLMASLTRAQYWEICTVTAGYSAILVVFLGSGLGSSV